MQKKILVIDDQPAAYIDEVLQDLGFEVSIFTSFSSNDDEILEHIKSGSVKYILVDYSLGPSEPSGAEIIKWLLEHNYDGAIIGISSFDHSNKLMEAAGAMRCINKNELVDKISFILNQLSNN